MTTYSFAATVGDPDESFRAGVENVLPPGGLSFRAAFPDWYGQHDTGTQGMIHSDADRDRLGRHSAPGSTSVSSDLISPPLSSRDVETRPANVVEVLAYMKSVFENPAALDELPLEAAGNPGAWHAWRSYRGLPKATNRAVTSADDTPLISQTGNSPTMPGDWNWEGVWENRVKGGIENSLSDPVLFGPKSSRGADKRVEMVKIFPGKSPSDCLLTTVDSIRKAE